jgi:hypothetical protein
VGGGNLALHAPLAKSAGDEDALALAELLPRLVVHDRVRSLKENCVNQELLFFKLTISERLLPMPKEAGVVLVPSDAGFQKRLIFNAGLTGIQTKLLQTQPSSTAFVLCICVKHINVACHSR